MDGLPNQATKLKFKRFLSISQAAKLLGVSPVTLRYWEKKGLNLGTRSEGGVRKYRLSTLKEFIQNHPELISKPSTNQPQSLKKIQGHFVITTKFAYLTISGLLIFGIMFGLLVSNLVSKPKALSSKSNLENVLSAQQVDYPNPEIKNLSKTGISITIQPDNSQSLSNPQVVDAIDVEAPLAVPLEQTTNCPEQEVLNFKKYSTSVVKI